jgi:hypothetical protein
MHMGKAILSADSTGFRDYLIEDSNAEFSYLDSVPRWIDMEIPCTPGQANDWERSLLSQVGKSYDRIGILDFIDGSYRDRN